MKRLLLILIAFFIVLLLAGGLLLKRGLHIENLVIGPAALSNISFEWQSKLELQIEHLSIDVRQDSNEKKPLDLSGVEKIIPALQWVDRLFAKISVQDIRRGDFRADFLYASSVGSFTLLSPYIDLHAALKMDADELVITVNQLSSKAFQSQASGEIRVDLRAKTGHGQLDANLANSLPVRISFSADQQQFSFEGQENGTITTITPFVDLFGLSQNIQRWITDYLTGSRYTLKTFSGNFPWDNPLHLLESFYAEVRVEDCQYTFAPGLEAVKTQYTDVTFKQGILGIVPHESTFYGQDGGDSWLDINFNDFDNILLTAYIQTSAVANADIMNLLKYYDMPLPFLQTEGKTKTDLTLAINLNTEAIDATGRFLIDKGIVQYDKLPLVVENLEISLKNSSIDIDKLDITHGKTVRAGISGFFDAGSKKGDIDIVLYSLVIPMGDSEFTLDTSALHPKLQYQIRPEGCRVDGGESFWKWNKLALHLGSFSMPFSFVDYSGTLPSTFISAKNSASGTNVQAKLTGTFTGQKKQLNLHGILQKFSFEGLLLKSVDVPVRISYHDGLTIENTGKSQWQLGDNSLELNPSKWTFHKDILSVASDKLKYGDLFEGGINGSYNTLLKKGEFSITKPLLGKNEPEYFFSPESLTLQLDSTGPHLQIAVPEFSLQVTTGSSKQWSAHISDLKNIHDRSPLLQQFKIDSGNVTVSSENGGAPYLFQADIPWHYPLLVFENKPITQYQISGSVEDGSVQANLNGKVKLRYTENLVIESDQILYNIPAIVKFFNECVQPPGDNNGQQSSFSTMLHATDSGFYLSPDSQIIADTITLHSVEKNIDIKLLSGPGKIVIGMEGEDFFLQGDDLDDRFMNALSPETRLHNGKMTVAVKGKYDNFSALVEIDDTVMENFNTLNNVLAFVNTIPALITFSLPSYSKNGLPVTSAVAGMKVVNGIAEMHSLILESPELSITGTGWIDFTKRTIEMDMNLITQSNKNMRKIPLVGYILAGKKKQPSITVKVSGDLDNPTVEHKVFKEVATIPFSMLYRTLALPAHIVAPLFEDTKEGGMDDINVEQDEYAK